MKHLADGTLRRLCDDPLTITAPAREHLQGCARCHARHAAIADTARDVATLFGPAATSSANPRARAQIRTQLGKIRGRPSLATQVAMALDPRGARRRFSTAVSLAVAAMLVLGLALTPAGSLAQSFFTIFQARNFAIVSVSMSDLKALPNLSHYGTMVAPRSGHPLTAASASQAATLSHEAVLVPGSLPADVPSSVTYSIMGPSTASFTFSAARARETAAKAGKALPPMPSSLDGSTLQVTIGPVVAAVYHDARSAIPVLVVAQGPAHIITSTGASERTILAYLLAQPGISPALASSLRAIGDPATTLPIPIPVDLAHGTTIRVRGTAGVVIGDNTGLGSAVVWRSDGLVHAVAGTLSQDEVVAIANGLH